MFKGSVASEDPGEVILALKGAAEPTRLRLLALLSHGEFTVGELCAVLGQSQPRISRHLRVLADAGFLDRFREQQCVYYRLRLSGRQLEWSRQLLSMIDPGAFLLQRDRERAAEVVRHRASVAAKLLPADLARPADPQAPAALRAILLEELGPAGVGELLDIGTGSGLMLEMLGPRAEYALGLDISTPALRLARARVHGVGLSHCQLRCGDMYHLPCPEGAFDTVSIDRVLATAADPSAALAEAARALRRGGRLLAIEDFEQLAARAADNPLAQLRAWLQACGLSQVRLRPCDTGSRHLLIALARRGAAEPGSLREALRQSDGILIPGARSVSA